MATFTVDTHLFRELGELLVGRDSTALIELIKNSYDADATEVVVYGESLSSLTKGFIRIQDNGIGMSRTEFENGFLRIASRTKEANNRRSPVFQRRYTGAKGIGRLAAHKLASLVEIVSSRWDNAPFSSKSLQQKLKSTTQGLKATIDWDKIETKQTLDEIESTDAIVVSDFPQQDHVAPGTTIELKRLRRKWSPTQHARFLAEMQAFEAPKALLDPIPYSVVSKKLLFATPTVRDVESESGAKFSVRLEGELAPPDDFWLAVVNAASWVIEISAERSTEKVRFVIAPTAATIAKHPGATIREFEIPHPSPKLGPFFHARILKRTGVQAGSKDLKEWAGRTSGVRVFVEGFRILPYGEPSNDWLSLDRDSTDRDRGMLNRNSDRQLEIQFRADEKDPSEGGLSHLSNKHYVGGVFLTEKNAPTLKMLVNREGFVPDVGYETLVSLVRKGIDLGTRVQAAVSQSDRNQRSKLRAEKKVAALNENTESMPMAIAIQATVRRASAHVQQAKQLLATGQTAAAVTEAQSAVEQVSKVGGVSNELAEEAAMMRILASVGTQLASFVHELNGLLGIAAAVDRALGDLRGSVGLSPKHKRELALVHRSVTDLKRTLERHASYLIDVVTPDARRRRIRQVFAARFDIGMKMVGFVAERRNIKIVNHIPQNLKSPPMFPAELTAIFSNLLTNAVKAAGEKGRIAATGKQARDRSSVVRIENTGSRVKASDGERWFRPFESSTTEIDPILGQGMGLGLPITRNILEEYGATIRFVEPSPGFATAVEMVFPE